MNTLQQYAATAVEKLERKRKEGSLSVEDIVIGHHDPRSPFLFAAPTVTNHKVPESKKLNIPRIIHQIWLNAGEPVPYSSRLWKEYAEELGYEYRFWSRKDISEFPQFVQDDNLKLLQGFIAAGLTSEASDLLRLEVLGHFGGCYFDLDVVPKKTKPKMLPLEALLSDSHIEKEEEEVTYWDLDDFFRMDSAGLVVVPERKARDTKYALTVGNRVILAAPHHPVIERARTSILKSYCDVRNCGYPASAVELTGAWFFTTCLQGTFTVWDPCAFNTYFDITTEHVAREIGV
jgi:mannosyltransferase OCH1-like enzyme